MMIVGMLRSSFGAIEDWNGLEGLYSAVGAIAQVAVVLRGDRGLEHHSYLGVVQLPKF